VGGGGEEGVREGRERESVKDGVLIKLKYFRMSVKIQKYINQVKKKLDLEITATVGVPSYSGEGRVMW
jgi:hypothetical protein